MKDKFLTDKIVPAFKLVHSQFHAARLLTRSAAAPEAIPTTPDKAKISKSPAKNGTQVETSVGQNVLQKSCELRSGRAKGKSEKPKYPPPLRVRYPTYEEREEVIQAARQAGFKSVSGYLRALSKGADYKPPRDPELTRVLLMLNRELTAQGNNLNQIARQRNGNIITEEEGNSMLTILGRSMLRTHKAVRQALSEGNPEPMP